MKMKIVKEQCLALSRQARAFEVPDMPYNEIPHAVIAEHVRKSLPVYAPKFNVGDLVWGNGVAVKVTAVLWNDSLGHWSIYTPGLCRSHYDVVAVK